MQLEEQQFNKKIGVNLKQIRRLHGYTQTEMAQNIGVSLQTWQGMEFGRNKPTLYRICQVLSVLKDISMDDILEGAQVIHQNNLSEETHELIFRLAEKAARICETEEGVRIMHSIDHFTV